MSTTATSNKGESKAKAHTRAWNKGVGKAMKNKGVGKANKEVVTLASEAGKTILKKLSKASVPCGQPLQEPRGQSESTATVIAPLPAPPPILNPSILLSTFFKSVFIL